MSPISSGSVNAEWAGPRRAAITTSRTAESRSASSAWSAMSVRANVVRVRGEHAGHVEGDVAVADDHHPFMAEIDWQIGEVGVAVDPRDQLGGGSGAGQIHPVDVEPPIVGCTDGVQHRVVVGQQLGVAQVLADLDVEVEPKAAISRATRSKSRVTRLVL